MKTLLFKIPVYFVRFIKTSLLFLIVCVLLAFVCFSCDDDNMDEYVPSRMFRPVPFTGNVNGTTVVLSWSVISGATYFLEISRDSLEFQTNLQQVTLPAGTHSYTVDDLWSNTLYSARIKAITTNPTIADSEYGTTTFTMHDENIFQSVDESDIETDRITLKWDNTKPVDRIDFITEGSETRIVTLSESDNSAGQKTITGLETGAEYTFRIWQVERLRGSITVKTKEIPALYLVNYNMINTINLITKKTIK